MRKKELSAVFSILMISTSVNPILGAEFSDEEEIVAVEEAWQDAEQKNTFSEEKEIEETEAITDDEVGIIADDQSEKDDIFMPEEVTTVEEQDVIQEEVTTVEEQDVIQEEDFEIYEESEGVLDKLAEVFQDDSYEAAGVIPDAQEIQANQLYSGVTVENQYEEHVQWYKFVAEEDGVYSLGCRLEQQSEAVVKIGTKKDFNNYDAEYFDFFLVGCQDFTLKKGKVYYIQIESSGGENVRFSLMLRTLNGFLETIDEIEEGREYKKAADNFFYSNWYKFIPKKSGYYDIDLNSEESPTCSVYLSDNMELPISSSSETFQLSEGKVYYLKVESELEDMYLLSVRREKTDRDYIEEIIERQGALPKLEEAEEGKQITEAVIYQEYGNEKTYMQFVPKNTGKYNMILGSKP